MGKIHFELTAKPITSHVGLALVGQALNETALANHMASVCRQCNYSAHISDLDNAKAMIGLLSIGKPHFDAIAEYRQEPWFTRALGLQRLPSPETLRQRIQSFPESMAQVWREFNLRLLRSQPDLLG